MSRPGRKVYEVDENGKRIAVYTSVLHASTSTGHEYNYLYNRIARGLPVSDHFFTYKARFKPPKIIKPPAQKSIFFDIVEWARMMKF